MSSTPTVVVAAALANRPNNGGGAWVRLSFVLGLERLGCRTFLIEQISEDACTDEAGRPCDFQSSANLAWFQSVVERSGLTGRAALVCVDTGISDGMSRLELDGLADGADLLLNVSGHLRYSPLLKRFGRKAFIDLDPGFTQMWHEQDGGAGLADHDVFFTVGTNIGSPGCAIPTGGLRWHAMRQPVVLDDWPVVSDTLTEFTTIAAWRGPFGAVERDGIRYGLKAHEFRRFATLPRHTPQSFEIALDIHPADATDLALLTNNGWCVVDPRGVAGDPETFRDYVQDSSAEFSVAKEMYVSTNSGWFSDRSVRYLASGKPVLVQDTGFTRDLPSGNGLVAFRTLDEAVRGATDIAGRYEDHASAARDIASAHFDADRVLPRMLDEAGVS